MALLLGGCATTNIGSLYFVNETPTALPPAGKDIFLTIDGTGNSGISRTNAARLFEIVDASSGMRTRPGNELSGATGQQAGAIPSTSDRRLATYYAEGVGSRGNVAGLALGQGMDQDVQQAYAFLIRNYRPGDRIYLSGFSRGAYGVRILAGLVALAGIPDAASAGIRGAEVDRLAKELFAAHKWKGRSGSVRVRNRERTARINTVLAARNLPAAPPLARVRIEALAIWDTVAALNMPDRTKDPTEYRAEFFDQTCNINAVFHALALDDNRAYSFTPILARGERLRAGCPDGMPPPLVREVWFAGAHADVGGGYTRHAQVDGHLQGVSLNWMLDQLRSEFLFAPEARVFEDPLGPIRAAKESNVFYKGLSRFFRRPLSYEAQTVGYDSRPVIHISALERLLRLTDLDARFDNCRDRGGSRKVGPVQLCSADLPEYGFIPEMGDCLYRSVGGYALKPGQQCITVECEGGGPAARRDDGYCGREALLADRLRQRPPELPAG
ncbi:DUF2235 domain-containing protein [Novosphingobium sp.]|uniref:phospholipase effector Tle1 domain-containing protein n=1 Tax=Novosphingobium sp. TaxID=1874826 RepID=UPI0027331616|nr:DUF2235 domain-containing protein [Novosphingobium sp.]MDP3908284.1 DUF2235 domain-containing protein [Novosphingobium sp.]